MDNKVALDTIWVLVTGMLVFFMNLGFGCVEAGFQQSKNCVNILSKNFVVFAASTVAFWFIGWGLMFGDGTPFIGLQGLLMVGGADNSPATADAYQGVYSSLNWTGVPLAANCFFQLVFAGTAATIVSGAVGGRIKYFSFIVFSLILVVLIYPTTGHWIWGGGWLAKMGFWDFAGSTVVRSVGGWAALPGAIILGPRFGKFGANGRINGIPGHNMSLALIGALVLWLGWFGFNPGSTMAADPRLMSHICLTTNMAACTGLLAATVMSTFLLKKPDFGMTINGCLAGLVAVTAPCAFFSVASAGIIGLIAGAIVVPAVIFFDKIKVDDPVGATSVHLVCGILGTIFVGLFAQDWVSPNTTGNGLFYGGGTKLLIAQLTGVAAVGGFVLVVSSVAWLVIKAGMGIRVSLHEEIEGLDIGEHGNQAYPDFVAHKSHVSYIGLSSAEISNSKTGSSQPVLR